MGIYCCLFDVLRADTDAMLELKSLLEDSAVTKVVHDCRQDAAALFYQKGIHLQTIFDTQVVHCSHIAVMR